MSDFASAMNSAIEKQIDERLNSFETALPGTVQNVRKDGRVDVRIDIRKMVTSGIILSADNVILGVPVMQTGFSRFAIDVEISKGDSVIVVFFSRDSSEWKKRKWGISDPHTPFANNVNSCVAIPFVRPDSDAKTIIKIDKDGNVTLNAKDLNVNADKVTIDAKKSKITGSLWVEGNIIGRKDIFCGTDAAGVSLKPHLHPTTMGPTSNSNPPTPSPEPET